VRRASPSIDPLDLVMARTGGRRLDCEAAGNDREDASSTTGGGEDSVRTVGIVTVGRVIDRTVVMPVPGVSGTEGATT
jgi:hypothetical protein